MGTDREVAGQGSGGLACLQRAPAMTNDMAERFRPARQTPPKSVRREALECTRKLLWPQAEEC